MTIFKSGMYRMHRQKEDNGWRYFVVDHQNHQLIELQTEHIRFTYILSYIDNGKQINFATTPSHHGPTSAHRKITEKAEELIDLLDKDSQFSNGSHNHH